MNFKNKINEIIKPNERNNLLENDDENEKRKLFYLFRLIAKLVFLFCFIQALINLKQLLSSFGIENINYPSNNFYVTNNNIALYSSYIIIDNDDESKVSYRIQAIVEQNGKYVKQMVSKENITCVLKYLRDEKTSEIIEINAVDVAKLDNYHVRFNRKFYFEFKLEDFKSFEDGDFNFNKIFIAVIFKYDFDKSLDLEEFLMKIKIEYLKFSLILPYKLIAFQKPEVIRTQVPRLSNVGVCGAQFYGIGSKQLFNWVAYQQSFGIAEIMIYDGTISRVIIKY